MKKKTGKSSQKQRTWVAVSGGFDPLHAGHLDMLRHAASLGDKLVVILNNDNWLKAKKGYVFMPETMRAHILQSIKFVSDVHITDHTTNDPDRSVCAALEKIRPDIFANGGDRFKDNIPEAQVCKRLGIQMVFNVGGGKVESSSAMIRRLVQAVKRDSRPWGEMMMFEHQPDWWVKKIAIHAGGRTSLQSHARRAELWHVVEGRVQATLHAKGKRIEKELKPGEALAIPRKTRHRLSSQKGAVLVEVAYGAPSEHDIVRYEDDYGRVEETQRTKKVRGKKKS